MNLEKLVKNENKEEKNLYSYKPSLIVRGLSWLISKFPSQKKISLYDSYFKDAAVFVLKNKKIDSLYLAPVSKVLEDKYEIIESNRNRKIKNLFLTSACSLSTHYTGKALSKTLEIVIKSNIGALPGDVLKKVAEDVKIRYGIEEKPEDYVKYSLIVGAINASLLMAAAYKLINMPETPSLPFLNPLTESLGNFKLWLTRYTLFAEIPTRTAFLYNKQILGILPLEFAYRIYNPFIKPSLENLKISLIKKIFK
ncbi:MAG: hypothetical protein QW622_03540 [Candidatus Pacearchaeota archaeon]